MGKDQYYMQILRTLYLHGILSPWDLFIAKRSALKRALWWSLKQTIMLSSSQDIGDLVSGDLVITNWSAEYWLLWDIFDTVWKVFLRAFSGHLDCWNQSSIPRVMVWMKFVTIFRGICKDIDDFGGVELTEEWFRYKTLFDPSYGFRCSGIPLECLYTLLC